MKFITVAAALGLACAETEPYNYRDEGQNWNVAYPACANPGGSPIDLKQPKTPPKTGVCLEYDIADDADQTTSQYTNQRDIGIKWMPDRHTTAMDLGNGPNMFTSELGETKFGGHAERYDATTIQFHRDSEHTVCENHFDLEMQIMHNAFPQDEENADALNVAVISILFSENKRVQSKVFSEAEQISIDTFFETLDWDNESNPTVNLLALESLMDIVDLKNRWVYKGSLTSPPCTPNVYWNVLRTIYPIKSKYTSQFKKQLERGDGTADGKNYRKVQTVTAENTPIIIETEDSKREDIYYNINVNIYDQDLSGEEQCTE